MGNAVNPSDKKKKKNYRREVRGGMERLGEAETVKGRERKVREMYRRIRCDGPVVR